jgi:hypothetical protein
MITSFSYWENLFKLGEGGKKVCWDLFMLSLVVSASLAAKIGILTAT